MVFTSDIAGTYDRQARCRNVECMVHLCRGIESMGMVEFEAEMGGLV